VSVAFRDRLTLNPDRIEAMAVGIEQVALLPDPVGESIAAGVDRTASRSIR
jgi:glutamate-5-semialdehyde dehydrogenase